MSAKSILVVDDEELLTKSMSKLLEKNGYDVMVAKNAQHAIDLVQELDFDLIITDVKMPGMNGVQMLQEINNIKSRNNTSQKIPQIVLTGYASDEVEKQAKELNVKAFLYKPCDIQEILRIVRQTLSE